MKFFAYSLNVFLAIAGSLSAAVTTVTGTPSMESGKVVMVDEATNTRYELRGKGLRRLVKSRVDVTGELIPGANGSTPIVNVTSATRVGAAVGKAANAGTAAGVSTKVLIATTVAVGGAAAGLYTAAVISDDEPASRP